MCSLCANAFYVPEQSCATFLSPQESDTEKDKDELAAPGSSKAKKKKKKKKKLEEGGATTQVWVQRIRTQNASSVICLNEAASYSHFSD